MVSKIDVPVRSAVFQEFLKYIYYDEIGQEKLTVEEILYLCELCDFYGLANSRLKHLSEQKIKD